ncbi:MAG TPA: MATE family efflux transporter [Rubrivivax sp.]|nr:MATE family efflux transporter [Rubrivivax sp.]
MSEVSAAHGWRDSAARILPLAWPVFIAQLAVIAFGTVDTLLVARYAALDLAALAVGSAAYITVFIGFMGVVVAAGPIVGQFFGAKKLHEAGHQLHQAAWVALGLSLLGSTLLAFPWPFLAVAQAAPEVEAKVRQYLMALAFALPAALLFAAYRGFNIAVSRPKAVMVIQLTGLALKLPLSAALVYGVPRLGIPELGVLGCGIATAVAMWLQVAAGLWLLARDRFYAPFALGGLRLRPPDRRAIAVQLRLGVPMGLGILVEVTGFAFMAIFIVRLGATPVAGHQLAANLVSVLFMLPLALGNATGTLVAQRIGARDMQAARRIGWHGLQIGVCLAAGVGALVYGLRHGVVRLYTGDAAVIGAALPLLAWVALFHTADAAQCVASFVLRAYRIATLPMIIFAVSLWGVGLGGGYTLAFDTTGRAPQWLHGARGFWTASTIGLVLAALALCALLWWVLRRQSLNESGAAATARA